MTDDEALRDIERMVEVLKDWKFEVLPKELMAARKHFKSRLANSLTREQICERLNGFRMKEFGDMRLTSIAGALGVQLKDGRFVP